MIVAVIAVRMVQSSVHQEVDMITMRHGFMSAVPAMLVRAAGLRGAVHRVCRADRDDMLVDMVTVHVVQMAIMQIIDMTVMANRRNAHSSGHARGRDWDGAARRRWSWVRSPMGCFVLPTNGATTCSVGRSVKIRWAYPKRDNNWPGVLPGAHSLVWLRREYLDARPRSRFHRRFFSH
jgi:hypothetical protein